MIAVALTDRLTDLRLAVAASRAAAAAGAAIDLAGLDDAIARSLASAELVSRAERGAILFALDALLAELDGLKAELRRHRDRDAARRAADAYGSGATP